MKKLSWTLALSALSVAATLAAQTSQPPPSPRGPGDAMPAPQGPPGPGRGPGGGQGPASGPMAELRQKIAGQEEKPAEEVFKNVQVLKGRTAGQLLRIMGGGYSRALSVQCDYCHVEGAWEKDDKREKQVARQMVLMSKTINEDLLKKIPNLKGPDSVVNCTTCHRGQTKPALSMGEGPRPGGPPMGGPPPGPPAGGPPAPAPQGAPPTPQAPR